MELQTILLLKMFLSLALLGFFGFIVRLYKALWLEPERLRAILRKQGIRGPKPSFILGNIPEMRKVNSKLAVPSETQNLSHDYASTIFPCFGKWSKEFGQLYMLSLGKLQILYVTDPYLAKEMSHCMSTGLGKPQYLQDELGPLLGRGILTSNGATWAHQRKTLAPELSMEKVKSMMDLMAESASLLAKSWQSRIESEGGVAVIRADEDLRRVSANIISKTLFGSGFSQGLTIISKLKDIQSALTAPSILRGFPGYRYIPTRENRKVWRLEKEVHSAIAKMVKDRKAATPEQDLLQMIIEGANDGGDLGSYTIDNYILDNCKNIYFAGLETTAISGLWCLILLASYPEWQERLRAEVLEICGGRLPDADMLRKMKTLTMVIQEVLRLYPPALFMSRETLQEMKLGDINVPKGVNVWISVHDLHRNVEIWGPDANEFNPERFANGVTGACKLPQSYLSFGAGPRFCAGQNFAMIELKIVLTLILSNFSFSLPPEYRHSPKFKIIIQPEEGLNLLVRKL